VVELGCGGLALPSIAAALRGGRVLASDWSAEAIDLAARNAERNEAAVETAVCAWGQPDALLARAPWDLVLAADVLYERRNVDVLLDLLPRLVGPGGEVWVADPGRALAEPFLTAAGVDFAVTTTPGPGPVAVHRLRAG
jgi:predicted nicotinamide N-methyase